MLSAMLHVTGVRPPTGVRRAIVAALASFGLLGTAGCGTIDDAQQVVNRADLVNDLANRLDSGGELTFLAKYQLASGKTATIAQAQRPKRSAYEFPGGKTVFSNMSTAVCETAASGRTVCTLTPPSLSTSGPPAGSLDGAKAAGLIHPTVVIGLLTAASLDSDAVINQADTTIAGEHATCVEVSNVDGAAASKFTACITADGALGSFSGDLDGQQIEVSLINYTESAPATAFDLPVDAEIVDRRPR